MAGSYPVAADSSPAEPVAEVSKTLRQSPAQACKRSPNIPFCARKPPANRDGRIRLDFFGNDRLQSGSLDPKDHGNASSGDNARKAHYSKTSASRNDPTGRQHHLRDGTARRISTTLRAFGRCVVWDLAEVEAWLASRRSASVARAPSPDVRLRRTRPVKGPGQAAREPSKLG